MVLTREEIYVDPISGNFEEAVVGHESVYGFVVLQKNRTRRDLSGDTLAVNAKDGGGNSKTFTFTADANQATTGKGDATLTMPAAELVVGGIGTVLIDLLINDRVRFRGKITLAASDAE
jgi:hypothetical protein